MELSVTNKPTGIRGQEDGPLLNSARNVDLKQLRYFVRVVESGSISRAAALLPALAV